MRPARFLIVTCFGLSFDYEDGCGKFFRKVCKFHRTTRPRIPTIMLFEMCILTLVQNYLLYFTLPLIVQYAISRQLPWRCVGEQFLWELLPLLIALVLFRNRLLLLYFLSVITDANYVAAGELDHYPVFQPLGWKGGEVGGGVGGHEEAGTVYRWLLMNLVCTPLLPRWGTEI